ncbi:prolipoprotein diacylglyceryl transferase [Candidatus Erwinia haradaeae]|uniref:Phosphatidylglycerol--prolipoprotein diacylglyceryl transferase n=1 Tax=Candidatus Erwinia haradaeae TaxID=1922217 RepID=A0A451D2R4_9GAMM|nr:prolipoprotein diacylglyceryl transferase [Candidatus Erwinia haradaeae]VFP79930.1 Prolipoprotein diacylglyceryl transferase [Candidatus Erwinia haradaeae]
MNNPYLIFPNIDPIIISLGPVSLHWYGLMYLISFMLIRWIAVRRASQYKNFLSKENVNDLLSIGFFGVFIGGRLGYMLFYNLPVLLNDPLSIFKIWNGGMSFHGGLIGVIIGIWVFSRQIQRHFFQVSDFIAPLIPIGLGAGRLGNYINGELWGRVNTHLPWATLFPGSYSEDIKIAAIHPEWQQLLLNYGVLPRHPSQLYEAILEGLILFIILNLFISIKNRPLGAMSGLFLISYSISRITVELFRQPDPQIGLFYGISMGQILSIPMIISGVLIIIWAYYNHHINIITTKHPPH